MSATEPLRSRRNILGAAVAAALALATERLASPEPAAAAGQTVTVGSDLSSDTATTLSNTAGDAIVGKAAGNTGAGLHGIANPKQENTVGVLGESTGALGTGIIGTGPVGVKGSSDKYYGIGVHGVNTGTGAAIQANGAYLGILALAKVAIEADGVLVGCSAGTGPDGVGVRAEGGVAIRAKELKRAAIVADGRTEFRRSGRALVPKGQRYVDVTGISGPITLHTIAHATLQAWRPGISIAGVRLNYPTAGKIRIYLTDVASWTANTPVAWLLTETFSD